MSLCLNPNCLATNPDGDKFCQKCGSKLFLQERYQAIKLIGQGGFGKTFKAVDNGKPRKPYCVIKQFFPSAQGTDSLEKASQLFEREAIQLDNLGRHPQIPELFAYLTADDNRQYLVQEYIEGQNLEQELKQQGPFNEAKIKALLTDILPVLEFIHSKGVIHRDIKPENIIRRASDNKAVLVDFGAAKLVTPFNRSVTGTVIGSAEYVAPEQANGKAINASDLYSLGVTCIYLLTQVSPFDLFDTSEHKWVWRQFLVNNPVSDQLGRILDKMIEFGTKKRYQSASEVLEDLNKNNTQYFPPEPVEPKPDIFDELEQVRIKSAASHFEMMPEKILHYYKDHKATKEEAEVIAKWYREIGEKVKQIKTQEELKKMIMEIEILKNKISRYRHDSPEYRWTNELDNKVLNKLKDLVTQPVSQTVSPNVILKSARSINYSKLEELLKQGKWKEADQETYNCMITIVGRKIGDYLRKDDIDNFPCEDLRKIDQLWVKYSKGHFGFSVQKKIWLEVGGKVDYKTEQKLGDRVGWYKGGNWMSYHSLQFNLSAPPGHLPVRFAVGVGLWGWVSAWSCGGSAFAQRLVNCNI